VASYTKNVYTQKVQRIFETIALLVSACLEKIHFIKSIGNSKSRINIHAKRLKMLTSISTKFSQATGENDMLKIIGEHFLQVIPNVRLSLVVVDKESQKFIISQIHSEDKIKSVKIAFPMGENLLISAMETGEPQFYGNMGNKKTAEMHKLGIEYAWSIPIFENNEVTRLLNIGMKVMPQYKDDLIDIFTILSSVFSAALENIKANEIIAYRAHYDLLTGAHNRHSFQEKITHLINKKPAKPFSFFIVDLDNFKYINDTFGHATGDDLLKEAAKRLSECARGSDTVARLGGDEFLLILDDDDKTNYNKTSHHPETGIRHVAERIIKSFAKPFVIEGQELNITPSIGFAIYPKDGEDSNKLMRHADAAMYRSKNDGKNTYCFYSPEMTVQAKMRMKVESQLRHALERNEFYIEYQPIVNLKSGGIVKAEALLRWNCDELGMITPDYFIPIAEETAMILPIGKWVIKKACEQVRNWRDSGWKNICITINVSARQFQPDSFLVETVREALKNNDLPSDAIQLELTEGILLEESSGSAEIMKQIENMGIKLLIDDFGTGYASLSYLQRYNFDSLKIDRSYIDNVLRNEQDAKLVKAVIAMANSLGLSVVSEGVETKEQLNFLLAADCELMQGYYFSKPVCADEFVVLLKKTNRTHTAVKSLELIHVGLQEQPDIETCR